MTLFFRSIYEIHSSSFPPPPLSKVPQVRLLDLDSCKHVEILHILEMLHMSLGPVRFSSQDRSLNINCSSACGTLSMSYILNTIGFGHTLDLTTRFVVIPSGHLHRFVPPHFWCERTFIIMYDRSFLSQSFDFLISFLLPLSRSMQHGSCLDLVSALVQELGFERTLRKFLLLSLSLIFSTFFRTCRVCVCVSKLGSDTTE